MLLLKVILCQTDQVGMANEEGGAIAEEDWIEDQSRIGEAAQTDEVEQTGELAGNKLKIRDFKVF